MHSASVKSYSIIDFYFKQSIELLKWSEFGITSLITNTF